MTERENWFRLIRNDKPGWITTPWEAFEGNFYADTFILDPIYTASKGDAVPGTYPDQWGVTWKWLEGHRPNPYITEDNKAITDITRWKEQIIFPPLEGHDWASASESASRVDRSEKIVGNMLVSGLFELTHYLMGFQDALCNYMLEPDHMYDLVGALADWKIEHLRQVIRHIKPDAVLFHDDWGNKDNLFLPPEVWRAIIKPHQKRIVDFVKSNDVMYIHHSDSICEPIIEDMAELGIDAWQGVIPQNDIVGIQKQLKGRMAMIGGIDAQVIDMAEADEQVIRNEVRKCIDTYCPQGHFIPCIPNILPIFPDVNAIYEEELKSYGKNFYSKAMV